MRVLPVDTPQPSVGPNVLGVLERVSRRRDLGIPAIPLVDSTRKAIPLLHKSGRLDRLGWLEHCLLCRDKDAMVFNTPLCPEACFDRMEEDRSSFCVPLKPTSKEVETSGPPRIWRAPYAVKGWSRSRVADLRKLESFTRDGLRASNASDLDP